MDPLAPPAPLDPLAHQDRLAPLVSLVILDLLVRQGLLGPLVRLAPSAHQVFLETLVPRVLLVLEVLQEQQDRRDPSDLLAHSDLLDLQVKLETLVAQVSTGQLARQVSGFILQPKCITFIKV